MKKWMKLLQHYSWMQLFYLWIILGLLFAFLYYILGYFPKHNLLFLGNPLNHSFHDFLSMIYFSFITLTATGYGDIVPMGFSRLLAVIETFLGLLVFGLFISKFISSRQQRIIEDLYNISFEEQVNKLRATLYVYRANISRLVDRLSLTRFIKRSDISDFEANLEGLNLGLGRVKRFLLTEQKKSAEKIDEVTLNLLFNSMNLSAGKIIEVLNILKNRRYKWQNKNLLEQVSKAISLIKASKKLYDNKPLKDELKSLLIALDESLTQLEYLIK